MIPHELHPVLADPKFNTPGCMDLVIGGIISKKIEVGLPIELESGIDMQNSVFGWLISGGLSPLSSSTALQSNVFAYTLHDLKETLEKFWKLEDYRTSNRFLTHEETFCEQHFEQNAQRLPTGRFQVTILFNENLQYNRNAAHAQLLRMERGQSQPRSGISKTVSGFHARFHRKRRYATCRHKIGQSQPALHLPSSSRSCLNASSKTSSDISLNEGQRIGPKVQIDSADLLIKTRLYKYMAKADIGKMFRKIINQRPPRPAATTESPLS